MPTCVSGDTDDEVMHSAHVRRAAVQLLNDGATLSEVSRETGISRSSLRDWLASSVVELDRECPRCGEGSLGPATYASLLGYYLGDGTISRAARTHTLRISCDTKYPRIIEDVTALLEAVHPARPVFHVHAPGVIVVQSSWNHWPCLFPQHGAGRKHERELGMQAWQWEIVTDRPADFLRGMFHSDGCRAKNWTRSLVAGEIKRYEYPRWHFTNESTEIMGWCQQALDLLGVSWRQSRPDTLSVSRRDAVARLDAVIGLKT